ncbi:molecular chaperone [Salmonella enterica subsp. enterica serovar 1,4,[5],12:i:-]|nr:molecular chaperone [Salmonella enterica]EBP0126038.1 molecular chaperone [Salmonella enterica]EFD5185740.1 molecular chaperone [Escherichia coli]
MKKILVLIVLSFNSFNCLANVIISNTRVIYPEENKEATVQLINRSSSPALIQAWLDEGNPDSTPENAKVPFLLTPPVVKVEGGNGQQLRIRYIGSFNTISKDKESVYYLNVLDIPPKQENLGNKNIIQIAIKSRIKMFYRPAGLKVQPSEIHKYLKFKANGNQIIITNDAPYYASIAMIFSAGNAITESAEMINPKSKSSISTTKPVLPGQRIEILLIDDYGTYQKYSFKAE